MKTYLINVHPVIALMFRWTSTNVLPWKNEGLDKHSAITEPYRIMVLTQTWIWAAWLKVWHRNYYTIMTHEKLRNKWRSSAKQSCEWESEKKWQAEIKGSEKNIMIWTSFMIYSWFINDAISKYKQNHLPDPQKLMVIQNLQTPYIFCSLSNWRVLIFCLVLQIE